MSVPRFKIVAEREVSWDDDIRTDVPELPDVGTPITLRHLHVGAIREVVLDAPQA